MPLALLLPACGGAFEPPADAAREGGAAALVTLTADGVRRALVEGDGVTVVNVWATWCMPCREEFPDLLRLERDYRDRGVRLMLVSADFADRRAEVVGFLAAQGVAFTSYLKDGPDMEFIDALSKDWSGSLPGTFIFDGDGVLRRSFEGKTDFATLSGAVEEILARDPKEGKGYR